MRLRKCRLSQELNAEISKIAIDLANARVAAGRPEAVPPAILTRQGA